MSRGQIFVVDDDADHLAALADLIDAAGYDVSAFTSGEAALAGLESASPDAMLTDLRMPGLDGFALLEAVRDRGGDLPVVVLTGHGDVPHAVRAIRLGAEDFLEKPYEAEHMLRVIDRTVAARTTRADLSRLQAEQAGSGGELLGDSPAIVALRARIAALAPLDVDVIVSGETGTGKELVARALHRASPRAAGPYLAINCAALPEALFEAEMFGYARGAFPGATADKPGKLEAASGGTLVLDEIDALPPPLQSKLLRALQERAVERLGENALRPLDLRIVATGKARLRDMVQAGSFRDDLFYRLAGAELATPPLREMGGDIALLFAHYASLSARRYGRPAPEVSFAQRRDLTRHAWPGNVRELRAAAERFALGLDGGTMAAKSETAGLLPGRLSDRLAEFEAREIAAALDRARGNTERAAEALGLPRRTLNDKMRRLGITG